MKFNKWIVGLVAVAAVVLAPCAQAQLGFDTFNPQRSVVLATPSNITIASGGGDSAVTNGPIDVSQFHGMSTVDITTATNVPGGTLTAQIYTSVDTTNLNALTNYAVITATTTRSLTNYWSYGSSNVVNNAVLMPGTVTTPSPSSGYFAGGQYLVDLAATNAGAITVTKAGSYKAAWNPVTQGRYVYIVWTPTTSASNSVVGALFNGPISTGSGTD